LVMVQPQNLREKCKICDKYCNESRSGAPRKHQNRFRLGRRPGPRWGSSRRSPDPLVGWGGECPILHPTIALQYITLHYSYLKGSKYTRLLNHYRGLLPLRTCTHVYVHRLHARRRACIRLCTFLSST